MENTEQDDLWMTAAELSAHYEVSRSTASRWLEIDGWPEGRPKVIRGRERDSFPLSLVSRLLDSLGLPDDDHPKRRK